MNLKRDVIKQFEKRTYEPAAPFQGKPIPAVDSPAHNPLMLKERELRRKEKKTEQSPSSVQRPQMCVSRE